MVTKTYLFDQKQAKADLRSFFRSERAKLNSFGSTVNQTFEAEVIAKVIKHYQHQGWNVRIENPLVNGRRIFKLKFNTKGAPKGYSYALCKHTDGRECQIRHGLRVQTKHHSSKNTFPANVVCDVVVMDNVPIDHYKSTTALPCNSLIAFGEVKHMSAFAELVASFIGLVFEMQPHRLKRIRLKKWDKRNHISTFLYVSGKLNPTAQGIYETVRRRRFDVDIFSYDNPPD